MTFMFEPMHFVSNLVYMGKGMLGIFVVIALIAGMISLLNKLSNPKS